MNSCARTYTHGEGVEQDYAEANRWSKLAAEGGNGSAMTRLGVAYHEGIGMEQDLDEALRWYRRAVAAGEENAIAPLRYLEAAGYRGPAH